MPKAQSIKKYLGFTIGDVVCFKEADDLTKEYRFRIVSFPYHLYEDIAKFRKHKRFLSCERVDKKEPTRRCLDASEVKKVK